MGLPFWTFIGVGVSGVLVTYMGLALEVPIKELLSWLGVPRGWVEGLMPFLILALAAAAILTIALWQSGRIPLAGRFPREPLSLPDGKQGIILLVSRPDSAMYAIEYHYRHKGTLRYVWLIPSKEEECEQFGACSQPAAEEIRALCVGLRSEVEMATGQARPMDLRIMDGVSPADAQDTFDRVNRVYRTEGHRCGLEPGDLIADFTGGTKPMSVGMIMACLPVDRSLQYVPFNPQTKTMSGPFTIEYQHSAFDLVG
jgi:hypothetical protein